MVDKTYKYRAGTNDTWQVYSETDSVEDWVADVNTETLAETLVRTLSGPDRTMLADCERLKHFRSVDEVLAFISFELTHTLEDDLYQMEESARESYTDQHRDEMRNKIHDVKFVAEFYVETQISDDKDVDAYTVLALSTAHLSADDIRLLEAAAGDQDEWMVMGREPGFFIKLYDELEYNLRHGHSVTIKDIIRYAHAKGYRMIEFDRDAEELTQFKTYEHA